MVPDQEPKKDSVSGGRTLKFPDIQRDSSATQPWEFKVAEKGK